MLRKMMIRLRNQKLLMLTLFSCLFFILGGFSFASAAERGQKQTIRVGYYGYDNYLSVDGNDGYSGYSYEFLKDIAEYTGWEYEFVYGTLEECMTRLENGEIDLMTSLQKTSARMNKFAYSQNYVGMIYSVLCVNQNREDIYYEDFGKFDGMKVGFLKGSNISKNLDEYAAEHNFRINKVEFDKLNDMFTALRNGSIDAVATSSFAQIEDGKVVARFQPKPGYFLTRKDNRALISSINNACNKIFADNLQYREMLWDKYYGNSPVFRVSFTREEAEFIKTQPEYKVAYDQNWQPVAYYDKEEGIVRGIAVDFLQIVSEKTGLKFDFVKTDNYKDFYNITANGEADIICGYDKANGDSRLYNLGLSKPYLDLPLSFISMKGTMPTGAFFIGIADGRVGIKNTLRKGFPMASVISYETLEDAMEAMRDGEVDFVVDNTYILQKYLQEPGNENLQLLPYGHGGQVLSFGLSYSRDQKLLSILNKVIANMRPEERNRIITSSIAQIPYHLTFSILVKKYLYQIIASLIFLFLAGFGYFYLLEKRKEKALEKIAFYDKLTGMRNFEKFKIDAAELVKGGGYVIVMFDINHFRSVTTGFGPKEGKRLLRLLCRKVADTIQGNEILAHGSNDLFILLLQDTGDAAIRKRLTDMQESIKSEIAKSAALYNISLAYGVYRPTKGEQDLEKMMELVDLARVEAKNGCRGGIVFYEADLGEGTIREAEIENKMDQALQNREFIVYYQPKYDLNTEKVAGAEALVRWVSDKGLIMPGEFIDLFERNGFVLKLDVYVFELVCADIRKWLDEGRKVLPIAVNVSRLHLLDPDFVSEYGAIISKYRVPPELLELELTEHMPMASEDFLVEVFNNIARLGVSLAIDDFGSGYSSLNILHTMPFDTLKIDQLFFHNKTSSERGRRIIETVVLMAQKLGMRVVAEGVETKEQVAFLKAIGCNLVQGYHFAKPMPSYEFEHLLSWEIL